MSKKISNIKQESQNDISAEKTTQKDKKIIDNYAVIELLEEKGFRRFKDGHSTFFGRIANNIVQEIERADMIEAVKNSIMSNDDIFKICNRRLLLNIHKDARKIFDITSLEFLKTEHIQRIRDTEAESYFFYLNTAVKVTKQSIETIDYSNLHGHVLQEEIIQRNFKL